MSVYITLDSNVLEKSNTIAEFRTKLGRTVSLQGEWTVGLSEITYTKSWYNVLNPQKILLFDEMGKIYGNETDNEINDENNSDMKNEEFLITPGFYETPQKLVGEINRVLSMFTTIKPPKLHYNEINNCVFVEAGKIDNVIKVYPYLGDELENMLGLKNRNLLKDVYSLDNYNSISEYIFRSGDIYRSDKFYAFHPVEISGGHHSLFLYSDIVYPSLIGDTFAPIMRVIEIPRKCKFGDTVHINYDTPHYRPIMCNEFETIEISIKDDSGELVPFKFGRCSLTLHFKKL